MASKSGDTENPQPQRDDGDPPKSGPNCLNYLNLFFYVANAFVTYSVGVGGIFGNQTNAEVSAKYQTLVTPAGWAFAIWAVIFLFQGIFAIVQLHPKFRDLPLVQRGVGYFYVATCVFQMLWIVTFGFEYIIASFVVILLILVSLLSLVLSQYITEKTGSFVEEALLLFPFSIHAGWIIAASVVNFNVVLMYSQATDSFQIVSAGVSLILLAGVTTWSLFFPKYPNFVIAAVQAWAVAGITGELVDTSQTIKAYFDQNAILNVRNASAGILFIIVLMLVVRLCLSCYDRHRRVPQEEGAYLRTNDNGKIT